MISNLKTKEEENKIKIVRANVASVTDIAWIMNEVAKKVVPKDMFVADDEEMIKQHIDKEGFTLLALVNDVTAGFLIVRLPGVSKDCLGYDLFFSDEKLVKCAHMESVCVLEKYRGLGIQKKLLQCAQLRLTKMGFTHFLATVHPGNVASLHNFLSLGYRIRKKAFKYGGKERYILYKNAETEEENVTNNSNKL